MTGYKVFMIIAQFLNIREILSDADKIAFDDENAYYEIIKYAKKYRLKSKYGKFKIEKIKGMMVPVIAEKNDGSFILIIRLSDDDAVILDAQSQKTESITIDELKNIISGRFIILSKKNNVDAEDAQEFGFKWFIPTILKFKSAFIFVLVAVFTVQILGILTPLMTQVVVDKVLSHHALNTLYSIAVGIFIVYVYELLLTLAKNYLFVHTTNRVDVILSDKLFKHLFALPLKYFESRRVGETVARVRELDSIRNFLTGTPLSSAIDLFFVIVYLVVLFFYSVPLAIIVVASLPIFALLSLIITPLFKKNLDEKFNTGAKAQSFLVEAVTGIQTVKSFALEEKFQDKWGELQANYVTAGYKTQMISQSAGAVSNFIQHVVDLLILVFGAKSVIAGTMSIGQLVAFRMLAGRVSGPVLRLVQLWQEYQQASLSVKRVGDIFRYPTESRSTSAIKNMPDLKGEIRFDKVFFRYSAEASDVLKGIDFVIKPGEIVGLVGRSGSGKSTISKLVQRLYIPQNGKISIDGMDLALIPPVILRKQIGVVLQENFMFNGTVAENISIHCPGKTIEEIIASAQIAGAHDFIMELPEGYDTIIGEKGVSLSGGQKQRVAIARAIINNPRILIFDEATSALDYESESIIQNNMSKICKGRTVIIIAHRLSTLKICDEIMVIDKGNLIERGSEKELLEANGFYAYLFNKQQRGEVE